MGGGGELRRLGGAPPVDRTLSKHRFRSLSLSSQVSTHAFYLLRAKVLSAKRENSLYPNLLHLLSEIVILDSLLPEHV